MMEECMVGAPPGSDCSARGMEGNPGRDLRVSGSAFQSFGAATEKDLD